MKRRPNPAIALCLCVSLLLQVVGCSSTDPCVKHKIKGAAPREYYVTYDSVQCIGRGKEVTLALKDQTVVRGRYWGIDDGQRPLPVYVILPEHLSQVRDSLKEWVPAANEWIIVYGYPSKSVLFEGAADDDLWHSMKKAAERKMHYMTPKLVLKPIVTAEISQGSITVNVPVDSISQVVRRETVKPDPPPVSHLVVAALIVATVGAVGIALAWAVNPPNSTIN